MNLWDYFFFKFEQFYQHISTLWTNSAQIYFHISKNSYEYILDHPQSLEFVKDSYFFDSYALRSIIYEKPSLFLTFAQKTNWHKSFIEEALLENPSLILSFPKTLYEDRKFIEKYAKKNQFLLLYVKKEIKEDISLALMLSCIIDKDHEIEIIKKNQLNLSLSTLEKLKQRRATLPQEIIQGPILSFLFHCPEYAREVRLEKLMNS